MTKQVINTGNAANDGTGDTLRAASQKINSNFTELYVAVQAAFDTANTGGEAVNLGTLKISGSNLGTQGEDNGWGDSWLYLDPAGEGYSGISIPNVAASIDGGNLEIYNNNANSGSIQLATFGSTWNFNNGGTVTFPNNTLDFGNNTADLKSSVYAELYYQGVPETWQANPAYSSETYVWAYQDGVGIQTIRSAHEDDPTWDYQWYFKNDGSIKFPQLSTNDRTGSGRALVFEKSATQKVIATSNGLSASPTVERLVIAGGDGYRNPDSNVYPPFSEGGDVYVWAGRGADGGDIKIDAGNSYGVDSEQGGGIKIRGGYSESGTGGYVQIDAGTGHEQNGGYVSIDAGYGNELGGDITLTAGGGGTPGKVRLTSDGNNWYFNPDGSTSFPNSTIKSATNGSLYLNATSESGYYGQTDITPGSVDLYGWNNTLNSGSEVYMNASDANNTFVYISTKSFNKPYYQWTFNNDGSIEVPLVTWNYLPTTFTAIPVTYGETSLTFTVLQDNTITNMSVASGAGGYGPDNYDLTIPGTTFPGGTSPANDIVFNVQTFETSGPVYSTSVNSAVSYVSGTLPSRYDNIYSEENLGIGTGNQHWVFGDDGVLTLPEGGTIRETSNTTVITPPGAAAGQGLVIRPTASAWSVTASDYITYGGSITISINQLYSGGSDYFGTVNYEISGTGVTQQSLGRALTGTVVFTGVPGATSETVTWTIPSNSDINEFTFTLTGPSGTASSGPGETDPALYYNFEFNALPDGPFVIVTNDGITTSETSHIHLVAANTITTDIYLGDDDQYVKIVRNGGNVVIGANTNTKHWTFGTDGTTTFPNNNLETFVDFGIKVQTGIPSGPVNKITANQGWGDGQTGTNLPTTGGSGTGLTVDVYDGGSAYASISINTPGSGYKDGETITVTSADESISDNFIISVPSNTWAFGNDGSLTLPGKISNQMRFGTANTIGSGDPAYPTALDLTKTVNKLADNTGSNYTLADGVEGQIMYLVPKDGATNAGVYIMVDHARVLNNSGSTTAGVYTDIAFNPFGSDAGYISNVVMLMFTDGAWQSNAGVWD